MNDRYQNLTSENCINFKKKYFYFWFANLLCLKLVTDFWGQKIQLDLHFEIFLSQRTKLESFITISIVETLNWP